MSELQTYLDRTVEAVASHRGDDQATAMLVRNLTREVLVRNAFLLECAERVISSIRATEEPWRNPPLFKTPEPPLTVRLIYWPPGFRNEPHLHGAWTVTGVFHNQIVVETFRGADRAIDFATTTSEQITASAGDTGYLIPPCVHRLYNPTDFESGTFHVFSDEWHTAPEYGLNTALPPVRISNLRRRSLCVFARVLAGIDDPYAVELLQRVFHVGDVETKLQAVKSLATRDIDASYAKSRELENILQPRDRDALRAINTRLAAVVSTGV